MTRDEAFELSKRANLRFDKSRDLQWKFNITVWTLIVAGIYFFGKENINIGMTRIYLFSGTFFLVHAIFVTMIQLSLVGSLNVENFIYQQLKSNQITEIDVDVEKLTRNSHIKGKGRWWFAFQILTTLVLLAFFVAVNWSK
jgi:hypothetical protein